MAGGHCVGSKQELVLVDTNIFVIDLRYKRDTNFKVNRAFLDLIAERKTGFTTIVNLLELCGILSFNLNETQLTELWFYFQDRYSIPVIPEAKFENRFPEIEIEDIFNLIKNRTSLGDALMISVSQKYLPFISTMVTWDNVHFGTIFNGTVLTPAEYLKSGVAG